MSEISSPWRPLSESADQSAAPWDGVPVLICTNHNWGGPTNRVHRAFWTDEIHGHGIFGWAVTDNKFGPYPLRGYTQVTHWMPLPWPPDEHADQLKRRITDMVQKFLMWPLPESVCSDLCVTRRGYAFPRSGTNLLSAEEAEKMIEYLLNESE